MIGVLFVCLGNICRSPLAEGIFEKKIEEAGLDKIIAVDSAGTSHWHVDELPDDRSIEIARRNGIILNHYGRQISADDLDNFDYIVAMDVNNYNSIMHLKDNHGNGKAEIILMRDFDEKKSGADIPDPYYGGQNGFQKVFDLLDESLANFLDKIIEEHQLD